MSPRDPRTEALLTFIYRSMSGEQKIAIALKMRENFIEDLRDSLRQQMPDVSDDDLEFEVRKQCLGQELAELSEPARREYLPRQREQDHSQQASTQ